LIWKIEEGKSLSQIVEEVIACYDVSPDHAARNVTRTLDSFSLKLVSAPRAWVAKPGSENCSKIPT
jgi:hypothetical protein